MAVLRFAYVHESSRWLPESLIELDIFIYHVCGRAFWQC
jgi:hypothetical protein